MAMPRVISLVGGPADGLQVAVGEQQETVLVEECPSLADVLPRTKVDSFERPARHHYQQDPEHPERFRYVRTTGGKGRHA